MPIERDICKMSRFYGFDYEYITNMDAKVFNMYRLGIKQISSEEILENITASSYPNMRKEDGKQLHKDLYKQAFPHEFNNPKNAVKLSDLSKVLK